MVFFFFGVGGWVDGWILSSFNGRVIPVVLFFFWEKGGRRMGFALGEVLGDV